MVRFAVKGGQALLPVGRYGRTGNRAVALRHAFGDKAYIATHARISWPGKKRGITIPITRRDRYVVLTLKRSPLLPKPRPGQRVRVQLLIDSVIEKTFQTYFSYAFFVINFEGYRMDVRGPPNRVMPGHVPVETLREEMLDYLRENGTATIAEAIERRFGGVQAGAKWEIVRGGYTYVLSYGAGVAHPGRGRPVGSVREMVARRRIGLFTADTGDWIERETSTRTKAFRSSFEQLRKLSKKGKTRLKGRPLFRGDRFAGPR